MARQWFSHPTRQIAWLATGTLVVATISILLASTNFFTEKFNPNFSALAALNISAAWATAKIWANYFKQQNQA